MAGRLDFDSRDFMSQHNHPLIKTPYANWIRKAEEEGLSDKEVQTVCGYLNPPKSGDLQKSERGMYYISIDKAFIEKVLNLIKKRGFELPPFFEDRPHSKALGGHIRVIGEKEVDSSPDGRLAANRSIGTVCNFSLHFFQTKDVSDWPGIKSIAYFSLLSDDLRHVREDVDLPPLMDGRDFILTVGVIPASTSIPKSLSIGQKKIEQSEVEQKRREAADREAAALKEKEAKALKDKEAEMQAAKEAELKKTEEQRREREAKERVAETIDTRVVGPSEPLKIITNVVKQFKGTYDWTGTLAQDKITGTVYLKLSDSFVEDIFRTTTLVPGFEKPSFLKPGAWGAHAVCIASKELHLLKDRKVEIPSDLKVTVDELIEVQIIPQHTVTIAQAMVLIFKCKKLEEFRKKLGLSEKPNFHGFYITLAEKPRSKAAKT